MKTIIVATGLSLAALGAVPASAAPAWMNYNRELTHACYDAAALRQSPDGIKDCNSAIIFETTTGGEERTANLVNRGILLLLANKNADAGRDFDEALSIDPRQPEALLGKAIEQWQTGNSGTAARLASESLQYNPRRPAVAYLIRGLANEQQGQLRAAYQDLQTAQRLEPGWQEPALQLQRYHVVSR
jgi:tetratricopeptide (TPR) repeat protein